MATETKVINVAPGSELGRFLEEIGEAPVVLEKDGERYVLAREDAHDIWADYRPGEGQAGIAPKRRRLGRHRPGEPAKRYTRSARTEQPRTPRPLIHALPH